MYESIGPLHAKAILGLHVFTGCDQIGRFYGKSKLECFLIFPDCQLEKLDGFIALGSTESIDSLDNLIEMLQEFSLDLYCRHRPDTVKDIASLRYYLFSKYQENLAHLPPTVEALRKKVKLSYYVAYVLKHTLDAHPFYPDPTSFGWVLSEGTLAPISTKHLPAPSKIQFVRIYATIANVKTKWPMIALMRKITKTCLVISVIMAMIFETYILDFMTITLNFDKILMKLL